MGNALDGLVARIKGHGGYSATHPGKLIRNGLEGDRRFNIGHRFVTWNDVLDWARGGQPLYYKAPLDYRAVQIWPVRPGQTPGPFNFQVRARTIRIWPEGSVGRGRRRTADPFTADAGHLDRFSRQRD